jgi:leucyl aminopeptidase
MIRLRYLPEGEPEGRLALVGKGIMYDSGGISLKPSDASHSTMKNDMSGPARCWRPCRSCGRWAAGPP